jgi:hypothetical protein
MEKVFDRPEMAGANGKRREGATRFPPGSKAETIGL